MKTSVIAYVYAIMAAAAAALVCVYWFDPTFDIALLTGPLWLTAAAFLGAVLAYRVSGSTFGEVSFIPYLTALFLYPSWSTLCVVGIGAFVAELIKKKPNLKRAFNVAQIVLAGSIAVGVYLSLGGRPLLVEKSFQALPHSLSVVVFLLVNTFAVAAAIGLAEHKAILHTWYKGNGPGLLYDILSIPIVYAYARAYVDWGEIGILAMFALVIGARFTYQSKHALEVTNKELLELFVQTVEFRDPYTSGHSKRVQRFSRIIAQLYGLGNRDVERVAKAALLHDVGKIHEIFAPILMKPGRLTEEERATMELHPIKSAELVDMISDLKEVVPAVRHHHENWDGTGYPDQLSGEDIPIESRIIMFADTIDAMTTDRPYRKALGEADVRAEIAKYRGIQFDPNICDVLLSSPDFARLFDKDDSGNVRSLTQIIETVRRRVRTPERTQLAS